MRPSQDPSIQLCRVVRHRATLEADHRKFAPDRDFTDRAPSLVQLTVVCSRRTRCRITRDGIRDTFEIETAYSAVTCQREPPSGFRRSQDIGMD